MDANIPPTGPDGGGQSIADWLIYAGSIALWIIIIGGMAAGLAGMFRLF